MGRFSWMLVPGLALMAHPAAAAPKFPVAPGSAPAVLKGDAVEGFAQALQEAGYRAKLVTNKDGERYIDSAAAGVFFSVAFHDCKPAAGCGGLRFVAWWDKPDYVTPAIANEWNGGYKLARAAIDKEGDLILDYYISLVGGVSRENFLDSFDWWTMLLGDFRKFLDEKQGASTRAKTGNEPQKGVNAADEDVSG